MGAGPGLGMWEKCIIVVSRLFWFALHFTDNDGMVHTRNTVFNLTTATNYRAYVGNLCKSDVTVLFADTHGFPK